MCQYIPILVEIVQQQQQQVSYMKTYMLFSHESDWVGNLRLRNPQSAA
jgi:hypothetical protein